MNMKSNNSLKYVGDFYLPVECKCLDYMAIGKYQGYERNGLIKAVILDNGDGMPIEFPLEEENGYCFIEVEMSKYFAWIKGDMKSLRFIESDKICPNRVREAKIAKLLGEMELRVAPE